jgi:hypothetical protein
MADDQAGLGSKHIDGRGSVFEARGGWARQCTTGECGRGGCWDQHRAHAIADQGIEPSWFASRALPEARSPKPIPAFPSADLGFTLKM